MICTLNINNKLILLNDMTFPIETPKHSLVLSRDNTNTSCEEEKEKCIEVKIYRKVGKYIKLSRRC